MKRGFVTGGSGFIGTNLVQLLIDQGYAVVNFDIRPPQNGNHGHLWVEGDIRDGRALINEVKKFKPTFLVHLAARTDLDGTTIADYSTNIDGVQNVIDAVSISESLEQVQFASSRLVCRIGYQSKKDDDYCPTTNYGHSKALGEKIVRDRVSRIPCHWLIFRPTSIWGPWFGTPYKEFFMSIIHGHYVHPKNQSIKKSFGYVGNTVYALHQLIKNFPADLNGKTIYMCDYQPLDVLDWAKQIAQLYGSKPPREVHIKILKFIASGGNLMKAFGYKNPPLTTFRLNNLLTDMIHDTRDIEKYCGPLPFDQRDGIKETLLWLREAKRNSHAS